jgi:hypothetical protein
MEVGGIEPPTRVVGQGVTCHCDQIVTTFLDSHIANMGLNDPRKTAWPPIGLSFGQGLVLVAGD